MTDIKTAARTYQQDIESDLGIELGSVCAPTTFYIEAKRLGYPAGKLSPSEFVKPCLQFDEQGRVVDSQRRILSECVRKHYKMKVISWNTFNQPQDIDLMVKAGYIRSAEEQRFFKSVVEGKSVLDLVRRGYHIVAGVVPGFAANQGFHAVILKQPDDLEAAKKGLIEVIDPDQRNSKILYSAAEIQAGLQVLQAGKIGSACSIILPPHRSILARLFSLRQK